MKTVLVIGIIVTVALTLPDVALTGRVTAKTVLDLAKQNVGYREGSNNYNMFAAQVPGLGWATNEPWCDVFTSWCFHKAGQTVPSGVISASCSQSVNAWKNHGRFSTYPAVGAQVFFGPEGSAHTGLVYKYDSDKIYTYEGNTNNNGSPEGDGVYEKEHPRRITYVYGYGYPDYSHKIVSADPKWGGTPTGSV